MAYVEINEINCKSSDHPAFCLNLYQELQSSYCSLLTLILGIQQDFSCLDLEEKYRSLGTYLASYLLTLLQSKALHMVP